MKKPNKIERDDAFWLNAKSPCCGKGLKHELTTKLSKLYQRWVCSECGEGWNNTKTDTWNWKQQGVKMFHPCPKNCECPECTYVKDHVEDIKHVRTPRERINFHDLGDVAKKLPRK